MRASPALPEAACSDKRGYVRAMFSDIAPRYDLLNRLLSFNLDQTWRRAAVRRLAWERRPDGVYLDACAGTLDLAAALARRPGFRGRIVAADFAVPMLRHGTPKLRGARIVVTAADTLALPLPDACVDGALVGFGLRNLDDVRAGLRELVRVLRPEARLVVLDTGTPGPGAIGSVLMFYFRRVLPLIGRLVSGHPTAYSYLPESARTFPGPHELARLMEGAGLREADYSMLTGGIVALVWGTR